MRFKVLKEAPLNEMAYDRKDAINLCFSMASEFIEHFHKAVKDGVDGRDFKHHCGEMNSFWGNVKNLKMKYNNKVIPGSLLSDWFFTKGSSVEDIVEEPYRDMYERLIAIMQYDRNRPVESIMREIISNQGLDGTVERV